MPSPLKDLVTAIIVEHGDTGGTALGATRLMKLLYLMECAHAQQTGQRLTGLTWKFHHFGPFAEDLAEFLQQEGMIQSRECFGEGKSFRAVKRPRWVDFNRLRELPERNLINRVVRDWGTEDLNRLLNHVYFETAPMRDVQRGDVLDFSKVSEDLARPRSVDLPKLSNRQRREFKKAFEAVKERIAQYRRAPESHDDPDLQAALRAMDEEDRPSSA